MLLSGLRLVGGLLFAVSFAYAQVTTVVTGTVTDPTGAVVPNASIELKNTENGAVRETTTDSAGSYSFPQLLPGSYQLTAKSSGFSSAVVNDLRFLVNTPATVNVKLEVGTVTDTVSVSAEAVQINTVDASLGISFGTKPIMQLPFEGRNVVGLLSLQPGVTFAGGNMEGSYRGGNVNGGKSDQANVTLDGVDVNDQQNRSPFTSVLRMTLDSVQEFRNVTTNSNADMGRSSGAQVSLITKSGTNAFHGSFYEYLRNKATNANSFFNNLSGIPLSKLNRNTYGASVGGRIIRDKLFFFANYEAQKDRSETSALRTVPSTTLRQGTLSYLRTGGGVATVSPAEIAALIHPSGVNQAALSVLQSYPMPNDATVGDTINYTGYRFNAPVRLDNHTTIGKLDFIPTDKDRLFVRGNLQDDKSTAAPQFPGMAPNNTVLGNSKGIAAGYNRTFGTNKVNNFVYGLTRQGLENTGVSLNTFVTFRSIDAAAGTTRPSIRTTPVHTVSDNFTWNKGKHDIQMGATLRWIRNSRVNYGNSFNSASTNASWLFGSGSELNAPFPDMLATGRVAFRDSAMAVMGIVSQGNASYNYNKDGKALANGEGVPRKFNGEEYEFFVQDTWKVSRGLTLTYGLRYSLMPPIYEANGNQTNTEVPLSEFFATRVGAAQLGLPQSVVSPVRYVLRDSPGGRPLYPYHKKNFAPRFALAYSPDTTGGLSRFLFGERGKSVIRAGWGMYYDLMGSGIITNFDASALGLSTSLSNPSSSLRVATAPRFVGLNTIPSPGVLLPPDPGSTFPVTQPNNFAITNSLDDNLLPPYTMNMNLSFSREFKNGWFVQAAYVGRQSRRSLTSEDMAMPINMRDSQSGMTFFEAASQLGSLSKAGTAPGSVPRIPFWENIFPGLAGQRIDPSLPANPTASQVAYFVYDFYNPDFTSALYDMDLFCDPSCSKFGPNAFFNRQFSYLRALRSIGFGSYNAFQWTVTKRFSSGDLLQFNYTLSKSIDYTSTPENSTATQGVIINAFERRQFRAPSDYDTRHGWNATWLYNLPFGKGQKFMDKGGFANAILGGWQVGGLYRQSSGLPTAVGNGRFWPTNWNITGYATYNGIPFADGSNRNAPAPPGGRSGANVFADPAAAIKSFDYTLAGQTGGRNVLRGDGNFNIDMNLAKSFAMPWSESHRVQFRWEVFNVTNTTRFDPFSASISLGDAGAFGKYTDTLTLPRVMQFALRYDF